MQLHENEKLRTHFRDIARQNRDMAIQFINDDNHRFCSLYILLQDVKELGLYGNLNTKYKNAYDIVELISMSKNSEVRQKPFNYKNLSHSSMRWMLETGRADDGYSRQFDSILDSTAALLIKVFDDKSVLPSVVNLMFERNRKGRYTYDIIWAFFEAKDPYSLVLVADKLISQHKKDAEFARKLLSFIPFTQNRGENDYSRLHSLCQTWILRNIPYLYYTGDSFQQTFDPVPYIVIEEAKYLAKPVSVSTGIFIQPLTADEKRLLASFRTSNSHERSLLTEYSSFLYMSDRFKWQTWIRAPFQEQLRLSGAKEVTQQ